MKHMKHILMLLAGLALWGCSGQGQKSETTTADTVRADTVTTAAVGDPLAGGPVSNMLVRQRYEVSIQAAPAVVYKAITDSAHFSDWTTAFSPKSYFEGTWAQGSQMKFLAAGPDGALNGLLSKVKENIPNQQITLQHFGFTQNGQEVTEGPLVASIAGSIEAYTIVAQGETSVLKVVSDVDKNYSEFMIEVWPKALDRLREICEQPAPASPE